MAYVKGVALPTPVRLVFAVDFSDPQFKTWGAQGGKTRASKLSKRRRRQIARKAAIARWSKKKNGSAS